MVILLSARRRSATSGGRVTKTLTALSLAGLVGLPAFFFFIIKVYTFIIESQRVILHKLILVWVPVAGHVMQSVVVGCSEFVNTAQNVAGVSV